MSKYIIKFLSFLADSLSLLEIMNKYVIKILSSLNFLLGKGYGSNSIRQEIKLVSEFTIPQEVKLCIDVGGNKGKYSEGLKKTFPNSKIIIFEPQHKCFELLQEKFRDQDNVQLIPKALSNFDGKSIIYSDKQGSGLASLTKRNLEHVNINFETTENVEVTNYIKK
jgi:FkbM family methyltransferase